MRDRAAISSPSDRRGAAADRARRPPTARDTRGRDAAAAARPRRARRRRAVRAAPLRRAARAAAPDRWRAPARGAPPAARRRRRCSWRRSRRAAPRRRATASSNRPSTVLISRRSIGGSVSTSDGMSNTSRRHSRYASSSIGNDPYFEATPRRSAARFRCCHSGLRPPGRRFGRSSARAAASRNFAAKSAVPPSCGRRAPSTSSDAGIIRFGSGGSSVSGNRTTNPSSVHIVSTSRPVSARARSTAAIAHGA